MELTVLCVSMLQETNSLSQVTIDRLDTTFAFTVVDGNLDVNGFMRVVEYSGNLSLNWEVDSWLETAETALVLQLTFELEVLLRQALDTLLFNVPHLKFSLFLLLLSLLCLNICNPLALKHWLLPVDILNLQILRIHQRWWKCWLHLLNLDSNLLTYPLVHGKLWKLLNLNVPLYFCLVDQIVIKEVHLSSWVQNFVKLNDIVLNFQVFFNFFLSEEELTNYYLLLLPEFESHTINMNFKSIRNLKVLWVLLSCLWWSMSQRERAW